MSKTYSLSARRLLLGLCCVAVLFTPHASSYAAAKKRVLVVSVTKGFHHSSIPLGEQIIKELGDKSGSWETDYARTDEEMAQKLSPEGLKGYDLVFFNNSSGTLPFPDRQGFLDWVKAGGGVVGSHAATDAFREAPGWPEFVDMMGAQFVGHGPQSEVECLVEDPNHPATKGLPKSFTVTEEVYLFGQFSRSKVRGLIWLDKHPNTGEPGDYPVSWVRNYGKGRVFYTSLGHRDDIWTNPIVQKHYTGGIQWALGLVKGNARPVSPAAISPAEKREGFRRLFNAISLAGWHPRDEGRTPWTAENGMLVMGKGGADLITDEKFRDFVIRYEYMIPKGGNSGVYLRGRHEIQVMDDSGKTEPDMHGDGSIYGKIAPSKLASKAPGEWNTVEAKLVGNNVTVTLNGVKIIDNQPIDGVTGGALDDKVGEPGPIMLQGDHGPVAYRNIRINAL